MHGPPPTPTTPGFPATDESVQRSAPPQIPDYELLRRIGSGSYGDVWVARNVLGQFRAVKIIYRGRFADPRPFEREFEGIQRFEPISRSHPSQLHILHVGKNDAAGCFYYVMELADAVEPRGGSKPVNSNQCSVNSAPEVPGPRVATGHPASGADSLNTDLLITDYSPRTLRSLLSPAHFPTGSPAPAGRLPIPDCVQIGLSLATALAHLHEQGLVHRDIKPSNIIFVNGAAKLGDIGLVTEAGDTQSIVGTEGYLPPEGPGTPQADLYSLGKVLYEIGTGMDRRRFPALPEESWSWADRNQLMEFNEIVLRACAKDTAQRYQTAGQLRDDLALLQSGKSVRHARGKQRIRSQVKNIAIGLTLLMLVAGGGARLVRQTQRNEAADDGPPSTNIQANALCTKALLVIRGDNYGALAEAYTNLVRATKLDPHFAQPYVGLLELRAIEVVPSLGPTTLDELRTIAGKLRDLAPGHAATLCAQSFVSWSEWDYPMARDYVEQSIRANPKYGFSRFWHAHLLTIWGWHEEGRREAEIALDLTPSKATIYRLFGHTYYAQRDYTNALTMYQRSLEWEPHHLISIEAIAMTYEAMGECSNAIHYLERHELLNGVDEVKAREHAQTLQRAFADGGEHGYWLERGKSAGEQEFSWRAEIQCHLGDTNAALELLQKSFATHSRAQGYYAGSLDNLLFGTVWQPLYGDPRFHDLLDKIGYTKVMSAQK